MNTRDFNQAYQAEWFSDPQEQHLHTLAREYHRRTEAFDRAVCTARHNGIAMPSTVAELAAVWRHAIDVLLEMTGGRGADFTARLLKAIQQERPH